MTPFKAPTAIEYPYVSEHTKEVKRLEWQLDFLRSAIKDYQNHVFALRAEVNTLLNRPLWKRILNVRD